MNNNIISLNELAELIYHRDRYVVLENLDKFYHELLDEAKRTSVSKISRQAKIKRATGQLAHGVAKKRNDPMYKKMIYHRDKYRELRAKITKKYSSRDRSKTRK